MSSRRPRAPLITISQITSSLSRGDYTIGVVCALALERTAFESMLDERHPPLPNVRGDSNTYTYGRVGPHNVVVASLPAGDYGTVQTNGVATDLRRSFESIRYGLMVGIAGAAPRPFEEDGDVRLGDVVVGCAKGVPSVVNYRMGKATTDAMGFDIRSELADPPLALRRAVAALQSTHQEQGPTYLQHLQDMLQSHPRYNVEEVKEDYFNVPSANDILFEASHAHLESATSCDECARLPGGLVRRPERHLRALPASLTPCNNLKFVRHRPNESLDYPKIHYGTIASADTLMKNAYERDATLQSIKANRKANALCFEMEAAGLVRDWPCLVIRGICDYSDSHKNGSWQNFAAATAAAFSKDLLLHIQPDEVMQAPAANSTIAQGAAILVNAISDIVSAGVRGCMHLYAEIDSMTNRTVHFATISSDLKTMYSWLGTIESYMEDTELSAAIQHPATCANLNEVLQSSVDIVQSISALLCEYIATHSTGAEPNEGWKQEEITQLAEDLRQHKATLGVAIGIANFIRNDATARASLAKLERIETQLTEQKEQLTVLLQQQVAQPERGNASTSEPRIQHRERLRRYAEGAESILGSLSPRTASLDTQAASSQVESFVTAPQQPPLYDPFGTASMAVETPSALLVPSSPAQDTSNVCPCGAEFTVQGLTDDSLTVRCKSTNGHLRRGHHLMVAVEIATGIPTTRFVLSLGDRELQENDSLESLPRAITLTGSKCVTQKRNVIESLLSRGDSNESSIENPRASSNFLTRRPNMVPLPEKSTASATELRTKVEQSLGNAVRHPYLTKLVDKIIYSRRIGYLLEELDDQERQRALITSLPIEAGNLGLWDIRELLTQELDRSMEESHWLELDIPVAGISEPPIAYPSWADAINDALEPEPSEVASEPPQYHAVPRRRGHPVSNLRSNEKAAYDHREYESAEVDSPPAYGSLSCGARVICLRVGAMLSLIIACIVAATAQHQALRVTCMIWAFFSAEAFFVLLWVPTRRTYRDHWA